MSQNKIWRNNEVQIHVKLPHTTLIKSKTDFKTERDYAKIKLRINSTFNYNIKC